MVLTVMERFLILGSVATQGDIIFLRVRNSLADKIGLSEEEIKKYSVEMQPGGNAKWNGRVPQETEIELSEVETKIIKDALTKLNSDRNLTPDHVSLYEKFVEKV